MLTTSIARAIFFQTIACIKQPVFEVWGTLAMPYCPSAVAAVCCLFLRRPEMTFPGCGNCFSSLPSQHILPMIIQLFYSLFPWICISIKLHKPNTPYSCRITTFSNLYLGFFLWFQWSSVWEKQAGFQAFCPRNKYISRRCLWSICFFFLLSLWSIC